MFSNSNFLFQLLSIVFSCCLSLFVMGVWVWSKSKGKKHRLSLLFGPHIVLFIFGYIVKMVKIRIAINPFEVLWSYTCENKMAFGVFLINIAAILSVTIISDKMDKMSKLRRLPAIYIISLVVAIAVAIIAPFTLPHTPQRLPVELLAKSYNAIPIDFVLEENISYFEDKAYNSPQPTTEPTPMVSPSEEPTSTPATPTPAPSTQPSESLPQTFADYMNRVDYRDRVADIENLKLAHAMYIAGKADEANDRGEIASMWFNLAFYDIEPNKTETYYRLAIEKYTALQSWVNVGAAYQNIGEYDDAIKNYRKSYQDKGESVSRRQKTLSRAADLLRKSDDASAAIAEYERAVRYFEDNEDKIWCYKNSAELYLSFYSDDDGLSKAVNEYRSALKLNGITGEQSLDLYFSIADAYAQYGSDEELFASLAESLTINMISGNTSLVAKVYEKTADYHLKRDDNVNGIISLKSAADALGECDESADIHIRIAEIYAKDYDHNNSKSAYLVAFDMNDISSGVRLKATGGLSELARTQYFSEDSNRYAFVIDTFNRISSFYNKELAFLYMQSLIQIESTDISTARLEHFEHEYYYHPKMLLYCSAIRLKQGDADGAELLLRKLRELNDTIRTNFNDIDLINYSKLLIRFGLYEEMLKIVAPQVSLENSDEINANRAILVASATYFARMSMGQSFSKDEWRDLNNVLVTTLNYFGNSKKNNQTHAIGYLKLLIGQELGEDIDYEELRGFLPSSSTSDRYLSAFIKFNIEKDFEGALEICDELKKIPEVDYGAFTKYDVLLLAGNIAYAYANEPDVDKVKYLDQAIADYNAILHTVEYLYNAAMDGRLKAEDAKGTWRSR
ncbi:hypothetical protein FACS1894202_02130 [Clostridia bacterium]|nr:hypothetical protein FACS1894202_02130 [Clostridia bacterium]